LHHLKENMSGQCKWELRAVGGNVATLVRSLEGSAVRVEIGQVDGPNAFDVQLNLPGFSLDAGRTHVLEFRARADRPRTISAGAAQSREPWGGLGLYKQIDLTAGWQSFRLEFESASGGEQARIHFDLGAVAVSLEIASLTLSRRDNDGTLEPLTPGFFRLDNLDLGALRRLTPLSTKWGLDRGLPIDRYYVREFIAGQSSDIRGRVLEIEDDMYTRNFGGSAVTTRDVLHVCPGNPRATIVADLTEASEIASNTYDCAIITQTLQLIYDSRAAVQTLHRILKPGGVLLTTFPGITRISHEEWAESWYWMFTSASARRLFGGVFGESAVEVRSYGNILTATALLYGMAKEDLSTEEVDFHDPDYEVILSVRAVKQENRA
jgi:SAM-dependent methyltransferase